jgi:hypothetical protein
MFNKKGFELSINMLIVIILGIVMLVTGLTIFNSAFSKVSDTAMNVDSQTQKQLASLLDNGGTVVMPYTTKEGERGERVIFSLGVNNELKMEKEFMVNGSYSNCAADSSGCGCKINGGSTNCSVAIHPVSFTLKNNEHQYVMVGVDVPKKISKGQYFFHIDVWYNHTAETYAQYGSKQVISFYVK